MNGSTRIVISTETELLINIGMADKDCLSWAIILGKDGESLAVFILKEGKNTINISSYLNKNCAVKVVNGKNTIVQAI